METVHIKSNLTKSVTLISSPAMVGVVQSPLRVQLVSVSSIKPAALLYSTIHFEEL